MIFFKNKKSEFETFLTLNKTKGETKMTNKTLNLTRAAIIAALYVVLTMIANAAGLASGAIQIRISEALTMVEGKIVRIFR